jgi:hypothetical protein
MAYDSGFDQTPWSSFFVRDITLLDGVTL